MKVGLISGQMSYENMTPQLNEKEYAMSKAHIWLYILNDRMKPTKWLKPNKNGTKVNFDYIQSQGDYDLGLVELEIYAKGINKAFDLEFDLRRE